jgi:hypothetical protein
MTGFRPEFLDFRRGIRVGNLEEGERITRILKVALEERYGQPFLTERWGRGVYWQWIGFLTRANREAKPLSSGASFGCAKFFVMMDTDEGRFKCGMQVERGYLRAPRGHRDCRLAEDWDWFRLLRALRPSAPLARELDRLVRREGFWIHAGSWEGASAPFHRGNYRGVATLRRAIIAAPAGRWAGFQLYYPMTREEVQGARGPDLVDAMLAAFREVTPAMNLCMQVELAVPRGRQTPPSPRGRGA